MINFDNYAKKVGGKIVEKDWYEWKVFVDENDEVLNKIDHVEYLLHPTFPNPRRVVFDRSTKFELRSSGWGQFYIQITVYFKDGSLEEQQPYFLDFAKSWP